MILTKYPGNFYQAILEKCLLFYLLLIIQLSKEAFPEAPNKLGYLSYLFYAMLMVL
jgi:hypothetical protein